MRHHSDITYLVQLYVYVRVQVMTPNCRTTPLFQVQLMSSTSTKYLRSTLAPERPSVVLGPQVGRRALVSAVASQMDPYSLRFDDASLESVFRTEQLQFAGIGIISNSIIIVVSALLAWGSWNPMLETAFSWHYELMLAMAIIGILSTLPCGRLAQPVLEHKLFTYLNVANVVGGLGVVVYKSMTEPRHSPLFSDIQFAFLCTAMLMVLITIRVLSFDFRARCIIHLCLVSAFALLDRQAKLSTLEPIVQTTVFFLAFFAGELIGFTLDRGARRAYLSRWRERLELEASAAAERRTAEQRISTIEQRKKQLLCEKDRALYDREMLLAARAQGGGHAGTRPPRHAPSFSAGSSSADCREELQELLRDASAMEAPHWSCSVREGPAADGGSGVYCGGGGSSTNLGPSGFRPLHSSQASHSACSSNTSLSEIVNRDRQEQLWSTLAESKLI